MTAESSDHKQRPFRHPFLQACGMFVGEMMCMVAYKLVKCYRNRRRSQSSGIQIQNEGEDEQPQEEQRPSYNPFIFLPPALCDMTATSIQYIGLTLTYASSFQMLRGAVIIFTGLLSMVFLRKRLAVYRWIGIIFVIAGLAIVGVSDIFFPPPPKNGTDLTSTPMFSKEYFGVFNNAKDDNNHTSHDQLIGDVLIVCAQVIVATQMVYEEKFIAKYDVPALQAVGWEGTFGFLTLATLLIPFYFIYVGPDFGHNPRMVIEDAYDGLYQLSHNPLLATAFCGTVISIAFFNFAGISVTKEMSATTRMVLDSVRTLVIWGVSLALGWQQFQYLQLIGFASLVTGMCIYNDIVFGKSENLNFSGYADFLTIFSAPLGRKIVNACSERYNRLDDSETPNPGEQSDEQQI